MIETRGGRQHGRGRVGLGKLLHHRGREDEHPAVGQQVHAVELQRLVEPVLPHQQVQCGRHPRHCRQRRGAGPFQGRRQQLPVDARSGHQQVVAVPQVAAEAPVFYLGAANDPAARLLQRAALGQGTQLVGGRKRQQLLAAILHLHRVEFVERMILHAALPDALIIAVRDP